MTCHYNPPFRKHSKIKKYHRQGPEKTGLYVDLKKNYALYKPYKLKVIIERDHKRKRAPRHGLQMK